MKLVSPEAPGPDALRHRDGHARRGAGGFSDETYQAVRVAALGL